MSIPVSIDPLGTLGAEAPLPAGYRRLKYLRSTGGQWIDTGFKPNGTMRWEIDTAYTEDGVNGMQGCGEYVSGGSYREFCIMTGISSSGSLCWCFRTSNRIHTYFYDTPSRATLVMDEPNGYVEVNGDRRQVAMSPFVNAGIGLFSRSWAGATYANDGKYKVYRSKIFKAGELVQHLAPALRIADNKPGMYDKVTGRFYTNAGTGELLYE